MKNFLLLLTLLFGALFAQAQVVTGVYKGKMVSDSLKYAVDFELSLKEKNGELYGYCQRLFLIEDVLYYNLVKVKARVKDGVLIVEDEKSVSNNFEEKRKGVKTVYMFNVKDIVDTATVLNGDWNTSGWRNLYAIPGKLIVNRERNYLATQLYKRLEEKKLAKEMLFEEKTQPKPTDMAANQNKPSSTSPQPKSNDVAVNENKPAIPGQQQETTITKDSTKTNTSVAITAPQIKTNDVVLTGDKPATTNQPKQNIVTKDSAKITTSVGVNKPQTKPNDVVINQNKTAATTQQQQETATKDSIKTNTAVIANKPQTNPNNTAVNQNKPTANNQQVASKEPAKNNQQPVPNNKPAANNVTANTTTQPDTKPADQKPVAPVATTQQQTSITTIGNTVTNNNTAQPGGPANPPVINNPVIVKRQIEIIDAFELSGDSVTLSLYDNGEIDGDTVSIFMNNELLVSKVGLKASAYKQTIALKPGEAVQLTLFAENLGSIPPNTGLLVITTNNDRYQVHFTSTLNKNSSIVLRRKE
ncbi:MAG: hypothetical protein ACOVP7_07690 [Lacibacter sp.]